MPGAAGGQCEPGEPEWRRREASGVTTNEPTPGPAPAAAGTWRIDKKLGVGSGRDWTLPHATDLDELRRLLREHLGAPGVVEIDVVQGTGVVPLHLNCLQTPYAVVYEERAYGDHRPSHEVG